MRFSHFKDSEPHRGYTQSSTLLPRVPQDKEGIEFGTRYFEAIPPPIRNRTAGTCLLSIKASAGMGGGRRLLLPRILFFAIFQSCVFSGVGFLNFLCGKLVWIYFTSPSAVFTDFFRNNFNFIMGIKASKKADITAPPQKDKKLKRKKSKKESSAAVNGETGIEEVSIQTNWISSFKPCVWRSMARATKLNCLTNPLSPWMKTVAFFNAYTTLFNIKS
ncbi:hypothetical protein AVEN_235058-1 [Araneus ventricosus]|uniref:Uncharacterized protein n=1 Tax=Araneus ventricosus TaxID=182803 RepID=A0A4Y2F1X9_ARAVE|nr:hypothetical protein AVEN_235058-1 [Araneus ventricosus]